MRHSPVLVLLQIFEIFDMKIAFFQAIFSYFCNFFNKNDDFIQL